MIKLYRGIVQGRQRQNKTVGTGIWFSTSIAVAKTYSDVVEEWQLDDTLQLQAIRIDCKGKSWSEVNTDALARKYADRDIVIFKDVVDVGNNWMKQLPDEAKSSKDSLHDGLSKYFKADDWVVNNPSCINRLQVINFKENKQMNIFESIYESAAQQRKEELQGLNEFYVPEEMRPKSVSVEEVVDNFFDNYCDAAGYVNVDKVSKRIGYNPHSIFAQLRTKEILEKYPINKEDMLNFMKSTGCINRLVLEMYIREFCDKHSAE